MDRKLEEKSIRISHALLIMAESGVEEIMDCYNAIDRVNHGKGSQKDLDTLKKEMSTFFAKQENAALLKKEEDRTFAEVEKDIDALKPLLAA